MGSFSDSIPVPYWHINVPVAERVTECPEFLQTLSAKDLGIISTPDAQYRRSTWTEVQKFVVENRIDLFRRVPSELRRYLANSWRLKQDYGSIMNFVLTQRLHWGEPVVAQGRPFECESDIKILWNDWPYGIDERIVHLVVWTKFNLAEDPVTGDLIDEARAEIDQFVQRIFLTRMAKEQVVWFKNWRSLKSVHAVEHFHVMLYDPDPHLVQELTKGDIPLFRKKDAPITHPLISK